MTMATPAIPPIADLQVQDWNKRSEGRADFMKRFFSVAVSVGFASKLGDLKFLSSFGIPSQEEIHQLILLVFATTVVVGSWEFYFRSIDKRPLIDWQRFVVDIVIVSLYIVFLLSVKVFDVFFVYLDTIMLLYIVWDILSMRVYPSDYGIPSFGLWNVFTVYRYGILIRIGEKGQIGPFITLWWCIMFALLFAFHRYHQDDFYTVAIGSAMVYIFYRMDQVSHWSFLRRVFRSSIIFGCLFLIDRFG